MNELEIMVTAPFRHGRKDQLSKMELVFYYVQDKRWMNPDQAKSLIDVSIQRGLLIREEGKNTYRCSPSLVGVAIPLGFHPSDEIFSEIIEDQDPAKALVINITSTIGKSQKDLIAEMQEISEHFDNLLSPGIIAILIAKKYGVSYTTYISTLRSSLLREDGD